MWEPISSLRVDSFFARSTPCHCSSSYRLRSPLTSLTHSDLNHSAGIIPTSFSQPPTLDHSISLALPQSLSPFHLYQLPPRPVLALPSLTTSSLTSPPKHSHLHRSLHSPDKRQYPSKSTSSITYSFLKSRPISTFTSQNLNCTLQNSVFLIL